MLLRMSNWKGHRLKMTFFVPAGSQEAFLAIAACLGRKIELPCTIQLGCERTDRYMRQDPSGEKISVCTVFSAKLHSI
jgi:hypothetical protein